MERGGDYGRDASWGGNSGPSSPAARCASALALSSAHEAEPMPPDRTTTAREFGYKPKHPLASMVPGPDASTLITAPGCTAAAAAEAVETKVAAVEASVAAAMAAAGGAASPDFLSGAASARSALRNSRFCRSSSSSAALREAMAAATAAHRAATEGLCSTVTGEALASDSPYALALLKSPPREGQSEPMHGKVQRAAGITREWLAVTH